ncbi:uncharacterized protein A4U43_C08F34680 [Asparagus officinalis]|uniref:patellin-4-like n=1 Tax=Asparagus officinalis TaxID=4686 RepID=UPI00098E453A|nr:patellin-4-like [Asparagus officinalis]ONK61895.1 uncharacterized protein A4U43_C08F34680 [Asparagus officinalis]
MIQRTLKWENEETREKLRSRVKLLEKGMRENGSMVQIIDLKDSSIASMKDLKSVVQKLFSVVDDNYPKFVEQHIFVNVSFRYYAYRGLFSRNLSQRTKSRFIFAKPSKVTETLLKFISPENIPIQYGGLQRDDEDEFLENDGKASEMSIKGGASSTVVIPVTAPGVTVVWDIAIVGWGVNYQEEFIPDDEGSYKVLIRKEKKLDEPVRNSYYISEPGKVVLTVANRSAKKKKILYRSKSKPTVPVYNLINNPDMYSAQNNRKILISG